MPSAVIDSIQKYILLEGLTGGYETEDLQTAEINGFYKSLATLINCEPKNIAFTSSEIGRAHV